MSYEAFILLPNSTKVTLEEIKTLLAALFTNPAINRSDFQIEPYERYRNALKLDFNDFAFYISLASDQYILEEAQEIALNHTNIGSLEDYGNRIEITSDEDMNMDYFNDYLFIVEELGKFEGALPFDPRENSFI